MEEKVITHTCIEHSDSTKRKYTKHTKDQLILEEYVSKDILPAFIQHLSSIKDISRLFLETLTMSKENWEYLYNIVKDMTDAAPQDKTIIAFSNQYLIGKYKEKHSTFYYVQAKMYIKNMLDQIEEAMQYDPSDEKELQYYIVRLYTAATHLYFFINVKEKL